MIKIWLAFIAIFLVTMAIDFYAFQTIITIARSWKTALLRLVFLRSYWAVSGAFWIFAFVSHIFASQADGPNSPALRNVFGLYVLIYTPKLVLILFLMVEDTVRLARWAIKKQKQRVKIEENENKEGITRSQFLNRMAVLAAAVPFVGMIHGLTRGLYNFQIHRVTLTYPNLPAAFDGLKITHISDIHTGSLDLNEDARRGFQMIRELDSDLVLFTGDLVNNLAKEALPWVSELKQIKAPMGVFSILGNHDYGAHYPFFDNDIDKEANLNQLKELEKSFGWRLLLNENEILERDGQKIAILGTENWGSAARFPKLGKLEPTTANVPIDMFKILMTHDPTFWDAHALDYPMNFDLTLSGHTHGMQFGVEAGGYKISPVSFVYPRWAGLYAEAKQFLYVNRGFGFIGFPGRVGIFPEITQITLKKGEA